MNRATLSNAYGAAVRLFTIAVCCAALVVAWRVFHPLPNPATSFAR